MYPVSGFTYSGKLSGPTRTICGTVTEGVNVGLGVFVGRSVWVSVGGGETVGVGVGTVAVGGLGEGVLVGRMTAASAESALEFKGMKASTWAHAVSVSPSRKITVRCFLAIMLKALLNDIGLSYRI